MRMEYNWNKVTCFYIRFEIFKIAEIAYKVLAMIDGHFVIGLEIQYFFQEAIADVTENLQNCNSMRLLSWLWSANFNNSKNSSLLHFVMSQITWSDSQ